jgi:hypothetical protein
MPRIPVNKSKDLKVEGILGVGLDGTDEQKRITRTPEMVLVGGPVDTHERLQEVAIRFGESLESQGKSLGDVEIQKVIDLFQEARDKTG